MGDTGNGKSSNSTQTRRDWAQNGAIIGTSRNIGEYKIYNAEWRKWSLLIPSMTRDSIFLHFPTPASSGIDTTSLSLQKALLKFAPVSTTYADLPYAEAFNWSELSLPLSEEREWYCVAFRSKRRAGSDSKALYEADRKAHEEAIGGGGLLLYWYGVPDIVTGMNLATCIWQSRRHAVAANTRPHHRKAMELIAKSYEHYSLERYKLVKLRGESSLFIMPYQGGEVGW